MSKTGSPSVMLGFSFCRTSILAPKMGNANLRLLMSALALLPANSVSNEQLVRLVVAEIEKHPEQMSEKFSVLASEVIMAAWPCKKYGDPIIVPACVIQPGPFSFCLP